MDDDENWQLNMLKASSLMCCIFQWQKLGTLGQSERAIVTILRGISISFSYM